MSWWGKLIGGTFGFMLGGPLGAILGASLGHNFDRGLNSLDGQEQLGFIDVEKVQSAFFTATFSMMGHLAKSDGRITQAEIAVAESVMRQMQLSAQQKKVAIALFEKGKQGDFPARAALQQLREECHFRRNLLQMFIEILIVTALADGDLQPEERQVLDMAATGVGFSPQEFQSILRRLQASRQMHGQQESASSRLDKAYQTLGVSSSASEDEVKRAYRRVMNQHHPDKLVAKGLPQEMMDLANQKTQEIKAAYELIRNSR
ncbi:MAG: co-chaperone DjlA [Gammaproteobacteria bacterium]